MKKTKRYEFDGLIIDIPIHYDEQARIYIEDYPDFIENPIFTKSGYRVLFSGTDACIQAESKQSGGCLDCAACKYFRRAAEHTWFGYCENENQKLHTSIKGGTIK